MKEWASLQNNVSRRRYNGIPYLKLSSGRFKKQRMTYGHTFWIFCRTTSIEYFKRAILIDGARLKISPFLHEVFKFNYPATFFDLSFRKTVKCFAYESFITG